jgi:predicted GNAT family acetyltransferase
MPNNQSDIVIYYFAHKELCIQEFKEYYKLLPSLIEVIYNEQMTVIDLNSSVKGKGYATALLVHASKEASNIGITVITLDDCSDNWCKPHNIYTKVGLEYVNGKHGPEMKGNTSIVSKYPISTELPSKIFKLII